MIWDLFFLIALGYFTILGIMDQSQIEILVYKVPIGKKIDQSQNNFLVEEIRIAGNYLTACCLKSIIYVTGKKVNNNPLA